MGTPKETWSRPLTLPEDRWTPRVVFGDWSNTRVPVNEGERSIQAEVWDHTVYGGGYDELSALLSLAEQHEKIAEKVRLMAKEMKEGKR